MLSSLTSAMHKISGAENSADALAGNALSGSAKDFRSSRFASRGASRPEANAGAAELEHFVDFLVDVLEGKNVAVLGAERAVEGAEGTILGAEIGVVDVAVDLVGDDTGIRFFSNAFGARPCRGPRDHRIRAFRELVVWSVPRVFP